MPLDQPDIRELRAIVDWVNLTDDVRELSIKYGDVELFISRDRQSSGAPAAPAPVPEVAQHAPAEPATSAAPVASAAPGAPAAPPASSGSSDLGKLADNEVLIKAPMVGTFYSAPKPGDPPFVAVGDAVTAASVLGIVEVMKLMNNIEARVDGVVARILVENEQSVEFGQPLMVITRNA